MSKRGTRIGRAARLRAHMLKHPRPQRAAFLAQAACKDATTTEVLSSLAVMARMGQVQRVGSGYGVAWELTADGRAIAMAETAPERTPTGRAPTPTFLPRRHAHNAAPAPRLPNDREQARAALEADIAAYLKAGGQIEQLGPTPMLARIGIDDADNDD